MCVCVCMCVGAKYSTLWSQRLINIIFGFLFDFDFDFSSTLNNAPTASYVIHSTMGGGGGDGGCSVYNE